MKNISTLINITEQFTLDHGKALAKQFLFGATDLGRVTKHLEHFIDKTNLKQFKNAHDDAVTKLNNFKADHTIEPDAKVSKQSYDDAVSGFDKFNKEHPPESYSEDSLKPKSGDTDIERFFTKIYHGVNQTKKKNAELISTHKSLLDNVEKLKNEHESVVNRITQQHENAIKNSNEVLQKTQSKFDQDAKRLNIPGTTSEKIARNVGRVTPFGLGAAALYPQSNNQQDNK